MPTGPGKPRQADLRRGVSDAYYAAFHALTQATARQALRNVDADAVRQYRRTLGHGQMRSVCEKVTRGQGLAPAALSNQASADPTARWISQSFVALQEERHAADYDHNEVFDATPLSVAIVRAEDMIRRLDDHKNEPGTSVLLALLALRSSWSTGPSDG